MLENDNNGDITLSICRVLGDFRRHLCAICHKWLVGGFWKAMESKCGVQEMPLGGTLNKKVHSDPHKHISPPETFIMDAKKVTKK